MSEMETQDESIPQEAIREAFEDARLHLYLQSMPVLHRVDDTFAMIAGELMRNHCNEDVFQSFNASWELLKWLMHNLEKKKETKDGKETD
jgi:hypothetical protein